MPTLLRDKQMSAIPSRGFLLHGKVQDQYLSPFLGLQDPLTFATCSSGSDVTSPHWKGGTLISIPTLASPASGDVEEDRDELQGSPTPEP